ncbi:MAG: terminase large subunit domain-containing protein [Oscillospiraceae bacterium]
MYIINTPDYKIVINYTPHDYQAMVHKSNKRFRVIAAGARGGKDYCFSVEFVKQLFKCANEDRPETLIPRVLGWIIAPTETIARQNWRDLKRVIPKELIADESRSTGQMTLINGVLIELHSAYELAYTNFDSAEPIPIDVLFISEAARIDNLEYIWGYMEKCLNTSDNGVALINSTPNGKNFFYKMFCMGNTNSFVYNPDWESFHWTTWDNPYMAAKGDEIKANGKTYRENLKNRMSDSRYRQDIMGNFID